MPLITSILLLAIVTAVTCSVPGIFLVLRHQSMLVDAMSHAVLPGIAIGALLSGSLNSPLLVVIATLMGLVVVIGAECLARTGLVTGDANQGLIFPVLFSIGVILLSTVLAEVHIDESTILAGNINLQALSVNHIVFGTIDIGPITMWKEIVVCAITTIVLFAMGLRVCVPGCAGRYEHRDAHSTAFPGQETSPDRGSSSRQSGSVDQDGPRRCTVLTSRRATDDPCRLPVCSHELVTRVGCPSPSCASIAQGGHAHCLHSLTAR